MHIIDELDLTKPGVVVGQHSVWIPPREPGALGCKIPFQFGGMLQKYRMPGDGLYPRSLIGEEVALLRWLAARSWAPPIGDWVYVQTVISEHPGGWWADPCGAFGYEMADATTLEPGTFTPEALRASGAVTGTPGAWNDLHKPGNIIGGRLIDVRRSGWDRLRWSGPAERVPPIPVDDALETDLLTDGQFPPHARNVPYQDVWIHQGWVPGERRVRERAMALRFLPIAGESVVDIGSQLGGFLTYAALRQGPNLGRLIGIDHDADFVKLARRLARQAGINACYRQAAVDGPDLPELAAWLAAVCADRIDHLLVLSMTKHLAGGEASLWRLVDQLRPRRTYLESNATVPDRFPLRDEVERRGGVHTGDSIDRNLRRLYAIERENS